MLIENSSFSDNRGVFSRIFCDRELESILQSRQIAQINLSETLKKGSIRGLHFQYPPHAEMKIIRCIKGAVFDVAVDLRQGSKTFLHWHAEILSPEKNNAMVIPEGCAHGFQTLEEHSELLYLHTAHYEPKSEASIQFDDSLLAINWPLGHTNISEKDKKHSMNIKDFPGIEL